MKSAIHTEDRSALFQLQQFVRRPRERQSDERCELCSAPIAPRHAHLLELQRRRVKCACDACAVLFDGNSRQRYRRIPRDLQPLRDFSLTDAEWDSLLIPINLAFFVRSRVAGVVAQYPSPGGVMEASLDLAYWEAIAERHPVLLSLEPDVEALLVNRISESAQYYRAPIDRCFHLVGLIRTHWRGLSGGEEVWRQVALYFEELSRASEDRCA